MATVGIVEWFLFVINYGETRVESNTCFSKIRNKRIIFIFISY